MESTNEPGLGGYLVTFRRRRWLMLGVGLPVVLFSLLLTVALPTYYLSLATFRFETAAMDLNSPGHGDRNVYLDSYVSKLTESVLAPASIANMRTSLNLPAGGDGDIGAMQRAVHVDMTTERILDPESGRQKDLNSGFTVRYDGRTPELAKLGTQWLVGQFLDQSRRNRHDRAMEAVKFLQSESEKYRAQIGLLENRLADFKQQHVGELPEAAAAAQGEKERADQELLNVEQELGALQQNRIFLESQLQQSQATNPDAETLRQLQEEYNHKLASYDVNHPDMLALRRQIDALQQGGGVVHGDSLQSQLATQRAILEQTRQRYSSDHPDVKRLQRAIAALEARIAAGEQPAQGAVLANPVTVQLQTQLNANESQTASLIARRAALNARLTQILGRMSATPQVEKQYEAFTRDIGLARDKYDELLKRKMDSDVTASSALAGSGDEFGLVQAPGEATRAVKSRVAIGIIGVILGGLLALGAALAAEATDQSVRSSNDVAAILEVKPLAIVPEIHNSIYLEGRRRRLTRLAVSLLVGVPAIYGLIRLAAS
jgi:polysaccharide biosynthesis transport protein